MIINDLQTIKDNSKIIQFPCFDKSSQNFFIRESDESIYFDKIFYLPIIENMTYIGLKQNHHHFTTKYHREFVLPTLEDMFNFGFKKNDFLLKKNIVDDINDITNLEDKFDLSFLVPKRKKHFKVTSLEFNFSYTSDFYGLICNDKTKKLLWFTKYHRLYCLPHSCSMIENLSLSNGKTLLILGDSQMIPSLAVICYYYKRVIYLDNRNSDKFYYEKYLKKIDVDDILIEMFNNKLDYYISHFR